MLEISKALLGGFVFFSGAFLVGFCAYKDWVPVLLTIAGIVMISGGLSIIKEVVNG